MECYAFWDLIAEETYERCSRRLKERSWEEFRKKEKDKRIYLFGCNDACGEWIRQFRDSFCLTGVLDNSQAKWGGKFEGLPIYNPNELVPRLSPETDAIVIAMRMNSDAVAVQLESLHFYNYYGLGVLVSGMEPYIELVKQIREWKKQPPKDIVMLESTNDFDGNSGALYEYLKKTDRSHQYVWVLKEEENKKLLPDPRDIAICPKKNLEDMKQYIYYQTVARWQIWDNQHIRKVRLDQTNVFLQHFGMGYKKSIGLYKAPEYVDYVLTTNEFVYRMSNQSMQYAPETKVIYGELPRNDVLFSGRGRELEKLVEGSYDKVVMWAPTLREVKKGNRSDSSREYPFGISVVYREEEMEQLNEFLRQKEILLLLKIHPNQKKNYRDREYSNIRYLDAKAIKKVHAYKLLTQMDAMISDYSSIVYDYMLLDRPIAWALDDMEEYQLPFLMENPLEYMPGEKLYCFQDLLRFLEQVKRGEDPYRQERALIAARCNAPMEGKGCEHIAQFLGL